MTRGEIFPDLGWATYPVRVVPGILNMEFSFDFNHERGYIQSAFENENRLNGIMG